MNGTEAVHYIGGGFGGNFSIDQTDRLSASGEVLVASGIVGCHSISPAILL